MKEQKDSSVIIGDGGNRALLHLYKDGSFAIVHQHTGTRACFADYTRLLDVRSSLSTMIGAIDRYCEIAQEEDNE